MLGRDRMKEHLAFVPLIFIDPSVALMCVYKTPLSAIMP